MDSKHVNAMFLKSVTNRSTQPKSQERRKDWTPNKHQSRAKRKRGLGKTAKRKAYRLMVQRGGDYIRHELKRESFMKKILPAPARSA